MAATLQAFHADYLWGWWGDWHLGHLYALPILRLNEKKRKLCCSVTFHFDLYAFPFQWLSSHSWRMSWHCYCFWKRSDAWRGLFFAMSLCWTFWETDWLLCSKLSCYWYPWHRGDAGLLPISKPGGGSQYSLACSSHSHGFIAHLILPAWCVAKLVSKAAAIWTFINSASITKEHYYQPPFLIIVNSSCLFCQKIMFVVSDFFSIGRDCKH